MSIEKLLDVAANQGLAVLFCLLIYREQIAIRKNLHDLRGDMGKFFLMIEARWRK